MQGGLALTCIVVHMPTEFTAQNGQTVTLDDDAVRDLKALSTLTREPEDRLIADAIERLRQAMVPSTKAAAAAAKPRRQAKPATAVAS